MANEILIPVPGRLHSVAAEGITTGADEIFDDSLNKSQETINAEVQEALGTGGSVDEKIAEAVGGEETRAQGAETALGDRTTALEQAVGNGGSVDTRISNAVAAAKSELKGNASSACDTLGEAEALIAAEATRAGAAEVALDTAKADKATTLAGYGITDAYNKSETYSKTEINDHIDTPNQGYITAAADSNTTTANLKTLIDTAAGSDKEKADFIYRVGSWDGSQYDETVYSEYAWNGTDYIFLSKKSQVDEVFDISAYHANTPYADLTAALGTNGANVPQALRKGGMSIKFIQGSVGSSDNKYVQYRLMTPEWSDSVHNWHDIGAVTADAKYTADFSISDEDGNNIVLFSNGHILTKNFDSSSIKKDNIDDEFQEELEHPVSVDDSANADLNISDEEGNVVVSIKDGHIKTKKFDSRKQGHFGTFSIIGDSISTFKGYTDPTTNAQWYPADDPSTSGYGKNNVTKIEQTWFYLFANEYGSALIQNNSYNGSPICYDGYDAGHDSGAATKSFCHRIEETTSPCELFFIFGGTNDCWAESSIGDYKYSEWTEEDKEYFRPAVAYLIDYAKRHHIGSKIIFLCYDGITGDYKESIETICEHYDIPLLVFENISKTHSHPNIEGMKQLKNQIIDFLNDL